MADTQKIKLFISYSHEDIDLCKQLQKHLTTLIKAAKIDLWVDKYILPGDKWDEEIKENLNKADIVVFLLSADFLASTYIYETEINIAYEKHLIGEVILVPVLLEWCHIDETIFQKLQGLPDPFKPISSPNWESKAHYFYNVVAGLKKIIKIVKEKREIVEKEKEVNISKEKELKEKERIEQERRDKERKEKEEKEQDEIVRQELKRADGWHLQKNYVDAFPIYYKYRDHKLFSSNNQVELGLMYENGYGVTKDYSEAVKWYRKSADQGDADGQNKLGVMFRDGKGVTKDYNEAIRWFRQAADQGNADGQNNLGLMYEKGYGVTKDYSEAVKWYRKSADQGNANGQNNLGVIYENGNGVTKDSNEAVKWFRKSAEQGNANGQSNLGWMYENGKGVEKDLNKAKDLYLKAAKQGVEYAQYACTRLNIKW